MAAGASPQVVIVGAGPAGMLLAYQLVSQGVPVRVLERHADFAREFRGEYLQSSVFGALEQSRILLELVRRGSAVPDVVRRMFLGPTRRVELPGGSDPGALVSQEGFLSLLHEACGRFPGYQMDFRATALEPVREGDRVTGLTVRRDSGTETVRGDVIIVCNGRNSALRKALGATADAFTVPADTLWLRFAFSDVPALLPKTLDVHMFGRGVVAVFHATTRQRLQVAYSAPGDLAALKKDLPALRTALLPTVPAALRDALARKLDESTETQVLRVTVDRLPRWHSQGVLFLGDAAHTMSPSGGQGLNMALRDAMVAANHLVRAVRDGRAIDESVFAAIEAERRPEIELLQAGQVRAHGMVLKPLGVLHVAFTMMGLMLPMIEKKARAAAAAVPAVRPAFLPPLP